MGKPAKDRTKSGNYAERLVAFMEKNHLWILRVLMALIIISGTIYCIDMGNKLRFFDEHEYTKLARNLLNYHMFTYDGQEASVKITPGYPFFLAFFMMLGVNVIALRILNYIILALCMYVVYRILKLQSSIFAGVIGAALILCYPILFFVAGTLYSQTLTYLLFMLIVMLLTSKEITNRSLVLIGLLFGVLILTRPTFIFAVVIFVPWLRKFRPSVTWPRICITAAIIIVFVGFWCARNYVLTKSFVFIASYSGYNMLVGNNENARPVAGINIDISKYTNYAYGHNLSDVERMRYYNKSALNWIRKNKADAAKLYVLKVLNYFNYRNEYGTKSEASKTRDMIMLITYWPLLLLGIIRAALWKRYKFTSFELLLVALYILDAFTTAIAYPRIRYRLSHDFLLIMLVAMFIDRVLRSLSSRVPDKASEISLKAGSLN